MSVLVVRACAFPITGLLYLFANKLIFAQEFLYPTALHIWFICLNRIHLQATTKIMHWSLKQQNTGQSDTKREVNY